MIFNNLRIASKINLAFATLIFGVVISSALTYVSIQTMAATAARSGAALTLAGQADMLLTDVLEQTNALRGYVIKGEPKFLATYQESAADFDRTLNAISSSARQPDDIARFAALRNAMATWRSEIGDKVVSLMATPGGQSGAATLSGVKSLTKIRKVQGAIRAAAVASAARDLTDNAHATAVGLYAIIGGGLMSMLIAGSMGLLLSMTIGRPVGQMTALMRRLVSGDHDVEIPSAKRADEVGEMGQAILSFKDAAIRKLELEADALATRRAVEAERDINEEAARTAAEELGRVVSAVAAGLSRLARGDLSFQLGETFSAQYRVLKDDFNSAVSALKETVLIISANAETIAHGAGEIASASTDMSQRTEQQAATLEQTAAALDQLTATVRSSAQSAAEAGVIVSAAKDGAAESSQIVSQAISAMSGIEASSREIAQVIGVIEEIAFQTNLLALNAGVEAARAGEAGRGFAIVASEVRALAQRSAKAAKEIETLIANSNVHVGSGVDLVRQTGQALDLIVSQVRDLNTCVSGIAHAANEQAAGLAEINTAVGRMDKATQQNAAMAEQTSAATQSLSGEATDLSRLLGRFDVGDPTHSGRSASGPIRDLAPPSRAA
jgi:methyl-accepting chemotaxis protein